jgi:hypothetical protein
VAYLIVPSEYSTVLAEVRKALGGVTSEAVRQRRARIQGVVSMPNDIALYVLAELLNLPLHRMVKDPATLQQVAFFTKEVVARQGGDSPKERVAPARANGRAAEAATRPGLSLSDIPIPAGLLTQKHVNEAVRMSRRCYPILYVFENSVREFVDGHLAAAYGSGWWDDTSLTLVSKPVRDTVAIVRKAENENRYHSARGARPIYYTTLGDLNLIVGSADGWKVFKSPRFPRPTWFPELIQAAEVSRNIVAHMNPLQPADIKALEMSVRNWFRQIADDLPPSVPQ